MRTKIVRKNYVSRSRSVKRVKKKKQKQRRLEVGETLVELDTATQTMKQGVKKCEKSVVLWSCGCFVVHIFF